jgi:hypothetical protein
MTGTSRRAWPPRGGAGSGAGRCCSRRGRGSRSASGLASGPRSRCGRPTSCSWTICSSNRLGSTTAPMPAASSARRSSRARRSGDWRRHQRRPQLQPEVGGGQVGIAGLLAVGTHRQPAGRIDRVARDGRRDHGRRASCGQVVLVLQRRCARRRRAARSSASARRRRPGPARRSCAARSGSVRRASRSALGRRNSSPADWRLESSWNGMGALLLARVEAVQRPVAGLDRAHAVHRVAHVDAVGDAGRVGQHQRRPGHASASRNAARSASRWRPSRSGRRRRCRTASRAARGPSSGWPCRPVANFATAPRGVALDACPPVLEYTSVSSTRTLTSRPDASTWSRPPKPMS